MGGGTDRDENRTNESAHPFALHSLQIEALSNPGEKLHNSFDIIRLEIQCNRLRVPARLKLHSLRFACCSAFDYGLETDLIRLAGRALSGFFPLSSSGFVSIV